MPQKKEHRIENLLRHPNRKRVWSFILLTIGIIGLISQTDLLVKNETKSSSPEGALILLAIGLILFAGYRRDKKFLASISESEIENARAKIASRSAVAKGPQVPVAVETQKENKTQAIEPKLDTKKIGSQVLSEHLWYNRIQLFSNGYIRVSPNGTEPFQPLRFLNRPDAILTPEKFLRVETNTDFKTEFNGGGVLGGAMLIVVTEKSVYEFKGPTIPQHRTHALAVATLEKIVETAKKISNAKQ